MSLHIKQVCTVRSSLEDRSKTSLLIYLSIYLFFCLFVYLFIYPTPRLALRRAVNISEERTYRWSAFGFCCDCFIINIYFSLFSGKYQVVNTFALCLSPSKRRPLKPKKWCFFKLLLNMQPSKNISCLLQCPFLFFYI